MRMLRVSVCIAETRAKILCVSRNKSTMHFSLALVLLSLAGLLSCYVFYRQGIDGTASRVVRAVCGLERCELLAASRYYRLLYFPNWYYGIGFYLLIPLAAFLGVPFVLKLALLAAVLAFGCSLYLAWALLFVLRTPCRPCYLAHAANTVTLIVLCWIGSH